VHEEQGIYRGEALTIMGSLSDIVTETQEILAMLRGYDEEDDEEMDS